MPSRSANELTPFEERLVDSVRAIYREQFPDRSPGSFDWRKQEKDPTRSLFMFFSKGEPHPLLFAKTSSSSPSTFKREFEILTALNRNREFAPSIPEVITFLHDDGACAIVEKAGTGQLFAPVKLRRFWKRQEVAAHIESVFTWWKSLVSSFPSNEQKMRIPLQLDLAKSSFLKCHGETEDLERCSQLLAQVAAYGAATPVISVVHGDLWRENIFCRGRQIFVFDWERADDAGLPLLDFLLFLSTLIDDSSVTGLVAVFWGDNWLSRLVDTYLQRACQFLGLSRSEAEAIFYYFLFVMSSQVMRLFGMNTVWDQNWYGRLQCALQNRESVRRLFLALPE